MKNKFTLLKNRYRVSTCGMIRTLFFLLGNIMLTSIMNAQVLKPRGITPNGPVFDMERIGNTLYVAGSFDKVGYSTGAAALIPIGDTLPNLNLPSFSSKILTAVPDGSGGWYIGGEFTGVNHFSQSNLVHILPSMAVDTSFKPNPDGRVNTLIIKDNKLYVGGGFTHMFGVAKNFLATIDLSTKALTSFNPAPDGEVRCLLINGSNLLVAGLFNHIAGTAHRVLAKINLTTFQSDSIPAPVSGGMNMLLMKGDTLFAGGSFNSNIGSNTGPNRQGILAISLSKNTLLPWAPKVSGFGFGQRINALACIDSIIYMGGYFGTINGQTRTNFGAVNVSGSLSPFNPSPNNEVYGLATHNDSLYVGGLFTQISSLPRPYAVRFGKRSVTPSKWSLNPNAYVNSFAFDNKNVMVGGGFYMLHYVERNNSCAFELPSLKLLPWKPFSNFLTINDVQTDPGLNRVYLVGYDSQTSRHLKAFDATSGDSIAGWHPVFNNSINKVALDKTSHHVYAAGRFTTVNQISKHRLAVFDKDGNLLNQPIDIDSEVRNIVVRDTSVYICGYFKNINGQPRNKIGSLNLTGKVTNWAPQTNVGQFESIEEIEALPDRINIGGYFGTAGGQTHQAIAAFDPKTGNVINWNPKLQALRASYIRTVGNGMFVADQSLTSVSGYFVRQLAFFDTNSSFALADFLKYGFDQVFAIEPLDSLVIVGGGFTMLDNQYHPYLSTFQMNLSVATSGGIRSVTPSQGGNNGDVTVQLLGSGFKANTTIKLHSNSGNPDISPTQNSVRVRTETLLTVSFDLRGQPLGSRDVIVITPGQTPDTLKNGLRCKVNN